MQKNHKLCFLNAVDRTVNVNSWQHLKNTWETCNWVGSIWTRREIPTSSSACVGFRKLISFATKHIWTKATLWDDNYGILLSSTIQGFQKNKLLSICKKVKSTNVRDAAVEFVSLILLLALRGNLFYLYPMQLLLIASTYVLVSN